MKFSLKKLIGISSASAEIADGHLILSFPEALDPIVWRRSLEKISSTSFEVKQDSDSNKTKLILKPKKGTAEIIAPFATRKEAIDALMIASKALQNTGSNNQPIQTKTIIKSSQQPNDSHETIVINPPNKIAEKQKWFIALVGALIVIGLYLYLITLMPETIQELGNTASSTTTSNPNQAAGVPISADDFFR